ncbi:MAG: type II toxin-antitoxin system RelE/ParE family toxin [Chloroflexi bacterium]|nr:type II toxin-antitoxin system RelE/ParE family toxin [Chloroflexota bacterium]
MTWTVRFSDRARRELARLDRQDAARVVAAVERFATTGYGDVKRLQGPSGELRLRVGELRVRFRRDEEARLLEILRVLPRGRAYRD